MFDKDKLHTKMVESQYTIERLASYLGINPATFYRKSIGKSEFTRSEIQQIAKALNLNMQDVQSIFFAE